MADPTEAGVTADLSTAMETINKLASGFVAALPKFGIAVVVFIVFWIIASIVRKVIRKLTKNKQNANVGVVLGRMGFFTIVIFGLLVGLTIVAPSMTPAKLLSGLGIGGVAIGFAFKDVFQNLLAGVLILLQEPFEKGDEIIAGDVRGKVEAIETRATVVRTYDGQRIIIPNGQIYTSPVTVITAYEHIRSQYDVGIGYGDDIAEAKEIMLATVKEIEGVLQDPAPDVLTWELAGSTVNIRVRWWTDSNRPNVVKVHDQVLQKVANALTAAHIDMPYPTQVLLVHDQTEETDGDRTKQREGWPAGSNPPKPLRRGTSDKKAS